MWDVLFKALNKHCEASRCVKVQSTSSPFRFLSSHITDTSQEPQSLQEAPLLSRWRMKPLELWCNRQPRAEYEERLGLFAQYDTSRLLSLIHDTGKMHALPAISRLSHNRTPRISHRRRCLTIADCRFRRSGHLIFTFQPFYVYLNSSLLSIRLGARQKRYWSKNPVGRNVKFSNFKCILICKLILVLNLTLNFVGWNIQAITKEVYFVKLMSVWNLRYLRLDALR